MANLREGRREGRIAALRKRLEKQTAKGEANYEETLAWISYSFSISRRTAKDYLDPMIILKIFKLHGDVISK